MKILYFDCLSGISGDMALGALCDLVGDPQYLADELGKLNLNHLFHLKFDRKEKNGISAFSIKVTAQEEKQHRNYTSICEIIDGSTLGDGVKQMAKRIFFRVAEAEAKVHCKALDEVHFHEVGAIDSIVDIVGAAILLERLKPDRIICSPLCDGQGFVECKHGVIPVPVPATAEILASRQAPFTLTQEQGEMITPTGAAIACETADQFGGMPPMALLATGYGCGEKNFSRPNVLRVLWGESVQDEEQMALIETNVDDCSGEWLGYTLEKLMESGAKDAFFTPIYMKKNRPAYQLSVLCSASDAEAMKRIIFAETTSIGVREISIRRTAMDRRLEQATTPWGDVQVKCVSYQGIEKRYPEFESLREIARRENLSLQDVQKKIK